jgi:hypothetical protein
MAEIILKYDERNIKAKAYMENLLKKIDYNIVSVDLSDNADLDKAIHEAETGQTTKCKDYSDYLEKVNHI